jgi:hypothetical protein
MLAEIVERGGVDAGGGSLITNGWMFGFIYGAVGGGGRRR